MMTHQSTRAVSGNCVSPWPCDLAAACSQQSIPRADTSAFPPGVAAESCAAVGLTDTGHTDRPVLWGQQAQLALGHMGRCVFHTWLGSVLSWEFMNCHQQGPLSSASCSICPSHPPNPSSLTCSAVQKRTRNVSHLGDLKVEVWYWQLCSWAGSCNAVTRQSLVIGKLGALRTLPGGLVQCLVWVEGGSVPPSSCPWRKSQISPLCSPRVCRKWH